MLKGWETSSNNFDCHVYTLYITLIATQIHYNYGKSDTEKIIIFNVCNIACISSRATRIVLEEMQN